MMDIRSKKTNHIDCPLQKGAKMYYQAVRAYSERYDTIKGFPSEFQTVFLNIYIASKWLRAESK